MLGLLQKQEEDVQMNNLPGHCFKKHSEEFRLPMRGHIGTVWPGLPPYVLEKLLSPSRV